MTSNARDRLFVALDTPDVASAEALTRRLADHVTCYKVGLELLFGGGMAFVETLKSRGRQVFFDMKLLDIPNTVEKATANIAGIGADYLTVHGTDRKTLEAAVRGRGNARLRLLAVTVLTSLNEADLREQGIERYDAAELVLRRARLAREAGFDGVIASGHEAAGIRAATASDFLIVTPGIRFAEGPDGDQARVLTPEKAIAAGASHLVVGRPITQAKDPAAAAERMIAEIARAAV